MENQPRLENFNLNLILNRNKYIHKRMFKKKNNV